MPKKKDAVPETNKVEAKEEEKEEKEEDPPIVKELKEIDDKYLAIEREYEAAVRKLQIEFEKKQQPFLDQRKTVLTKGEGTGTPAIKGFWRTALKNHPGFEEQIQEWDEPVLDYLIDITKEHLKEDDEHAGFKLVFHFSENEFFENTTLWKEYHTAEGSPYTGEMDVKHIKVSEIKWKSGKDVTVEKVQKKVKGGGAKKAKQKSKEKEEARPSIFRTFFRELQEGMPPPEGIEEELGEEIDPEDLEGEGGLVEFLMENDYEAGSALKDSIIPFAIRWYTGECCDSDEDDDDEDEESEDDDDDDDDEDSEDDEEPKGKGKGRGAKPKKGAAKKSPKQSPSSGPAGEPAKTEECKQQ